MASKKTFTAVAVFLIILLSIIVYANSLRQDFVWDGVREIKNNPLLRNVGNIPRFFTSDYFGMYRPLEQASYVFNFYLNGLSPLGYHLVNLSLHIITSFFLFLLIRLILANNIAAFAGALLFAVHPVHVEAVTWIAARDEIMAGMFFILAFFLYVKNSRETQDKKVFYYVFSLFFYLLALFSKEMAITFPLIAISYDLIFVKKQDAKITVFFKNNFRKYFYLFLITGLYLGVRLSVVGFIDKTRTFYGDSLYLTLLNIPHVYLFNLKLLLYPVKLCHNYYFPPYESGFALKSVLSILAVIILLFSFKWKSKAALFSFSVLWFFITLLPTTKLTLTQAQLIADRYLYIPSLGICILAGCVFSKALEKSKTVAVKALVVLSLCSIIISFAAKTMQRNRDWNSDFCLLKSAVRDFPKDPRAYFNLANYYKASRNFDEAVALYHKTLEFNPKVGFVHYELAQAYQGENLCDKARGEYLKAIEYGYKMPAVYNNFGVLCLNTGRIDEAVELFKKAVQKDSFFAQGYYNLGICCKQKNSMEEAKKNWIKAIKINPSYAQAYLNLANLFYEENKLKDVIYYYQEALKILPRDLGMRYSLGLVYAKMGEKEKARKELEYILNFDANNEEVKKILLELDV